MQMRARLLPSFEVLNTQDLDEAREAVSMRYCDHRLDLARGRVLNVRHNHARGSHVSVNFLAYGGDVEIDPGELQDFYLLQIPVTGSARIQHRGEEVDTSPRQGSMLNPDRPTRMAWGHDCEKLMIQVDVAFLHLVATEWLGRTLPGQIRFEPAVDLRTPEGKTLRYIAERTAQAFEVGTLASRLEDLQLMATEREIALTLLHNLRSNITHLMARKPAVLAPRSLRRALDYLHGHYAEDIRLDDIARATDQHPRTLQIAFQRSLGTSPMAYLRDIRLDTAKYHLSRRVNRPRVSEIAYDCGFSHLGRFSKDFRVRFGHAPSECG